MTDQQKLRRQKEVRFFGLGETHSSTMQVVREAVERHADGALDILYGNIAADGELAQLFGSPAVIRHAREKQLEHWRNLFTTGLDDRFFESARNIGNVHARIGLDPAWYVGSYALVIETIVTGMMRHSLRRRLSGKVLSQAIGLLVKSALFDMQIALSTYFDAASRERGETISALSNALDALAKGDVGTSLTGLGKEYQQIEMDYELMRTNMRQALLDVAEAAEVIRTGSSEMDAASTDLADRTERQAAAIQQTASAMDQLTVTVRQTAQGASDVRRSVNSATEDTLLGGDVVGKAVQAMADIERSAGEITQIITLIDGIAFQTNLLALNAGVEAARAGDAGRGFAVVASEVRALAQRSADAAEDIKQLVTRSSSQVATGVQFVGQTGEALGRIAERISEIGTLITTISGAAEEQATGISEANIAVSSMDRAIQQNAAMCEEATAASKSLSAEAARLAELVSRFQLNDTSRRAESVLAKQRSKLRSVG